MFECFLARVESRADGLWRRRVVEVQPTARFRELAENLLRQGSHSLVSNFIKTQIDLAIFAHFLNVATHARTNSEGRTDRCSIDQSAMRVLDNDAVAKFGFFEDKQFDFLIYRVLRLRSTQMLRHERRRDDAICLFVVQDFHDHLLANLHMRPLLAIGQ